MRLISPFRPDPAYFQDPYATYKLLRDEDPVHRSGFGPWLVSRHDDCVQVLRDPRCVRDKGLARGSSASEPADFFERMRRKWMVYRDPPDHTRLRRLFAKAFTSNMVRGLTPAIERLTSELLDPLDRDGGMDLVRDFAFHLPVGIIARMLGVPDPDRALFRDWSLALALGVDIGASAERATEADVAARELHDYLTDLVEARQRDRRDDLVSALLTAEADGDRIDRSELVANAALLLFAGHETTAQYLSSGVLALLEHPNERRALAENPALMATAAGERLRYEPPLLVVARYAAHDFTLGARSIARGDQLVLLLGSANRDPRRFTDPDRLDLRRDEAEPLTFSGGIHYCLGAPLARLEGSIAFTHLLKRFPTLHTVDGFKPTYRDTLAFRALTALPIQT